jgi:hypothetical protein
LLPVTLAALGLWPQNWMMVFAWIAAIGLASVCGIAAIVLGIAGWKSGAGKTAAIVAERLRAALTRRLAETGARCDDVQVTVADHLDKATVRFRGLQGFANANGTTMHNANGSFTLLPDGQGHWRGTLAGVPVKLRTAPATPSGPGSARAAPRSPASSPPRKPR